MVSFLAIRQGEFGTIARRVLALLITVWVVQGCASYSDKTALVRGFYQGQDYDLALAKLEESPLKTEDRNRLLYQLEKAQILDRQGDLKASRAALLRADKIADDLYTTSISAQLTSFVVNDASTEYEGEDFEVVAIHIALALSFLEEQDLKGALVEARKINSKLGEINHRYSDHKNRYTEDAFARYLAGMIYEASGNDDSAIVDYKRSIKAYDELYGPQFGVKAPLGLLRSYYRVLQRRGRYSQARTFLKGRSLSKADLDLPPASYGRVVVIHEVDTINGKVNADHLMPWSDKYMRFSFPQIAPTPYPAAQSAAVRAAQAAALAEAKAEAQAKAKAEAEAKAKAEGKGLAGAKGAKPKPIPRVKVGPMSRGFGIARAGSTGNRTIHRPEMVQDMNIIAHHTLEDRRGRIFAKSVARLIVKDQLAQKAQKEFGPVAGLLVGIAGMATETGDTRSWALLPAAYQVSELYLPAGRHKVVVHHRGKPQELRTVMVRAGRPVFIRAK